MKRFATFLVSMVMGVMFLAVPVPVQAQINPCSDPVVADSEICRAQTGRDRLFGQGSIWSRILSAITFIIGAVAVLMIIIGALRYALSAGDQSQITAAKNTILYAAIALIIAVMANAIVNFVLTNV